MNQQHQLNHEELNRLAVGVNQLVTRFEVGTIIMMTERVRKIARENPDDPKGAAHSQASISMPIVEAVFEHIEGKIDFDQMRKEIERLSLAEAKAVQPKAG